MYSLFMEKGTTKVYGVLGAPLLILMGLSLLGWAWYNLGSLGQLLAEHTEVTRSASSLYLVRGITGE